MSAEVSGPGAAYFPAPVLARIGRTLIEDGEFIAEMVALELEEPTSYIIIDGEPYSYQLTYQQYGRQGVTRRVDRSHVYHVRSNTNIQTQRGISPLGAARQLKKISQRMERAISYESDAPPGYVMPLARVTEDQRTAISNQLATLRGKIAVTETAVAGFDQGQASGPYQDWRQQRFGPTIPESSVQVQEMAYYQILAATGTPPDLFRPGDGSAKREAYRQFLHLTVKPLSRLVEYEAMRINAPIKLDFRGLGAADVASKARAMMALVKAGLTVEDAAYQAGLE